MHSVPSGTVLVPAGVSDVETRLPLIESLPSVSTRKGRSGVQPDAITATFDNGVLTVEVPRAPRPDPRRIQVQAGEQSRHAQSGGMMQTDGEAQGSQGGEASGDVQSSAESQQQSSEASRSEASSSS